MTVAFVSPRYVPFPARYHAILSREPNCVLLKTSRCDEENRKSYLFLRPSEIVSIHDPGQVPELFATIESCLARNCFVAGFLAYECGYGFQDLRPVPPGSSQLPLAWFGVYEAPFVFNHGTGAFEGAHPDEFLDRAPALAEEGQFAVHNWRLAMPEEEYFSKVGMIKNYILAGDTYQVNLCQKLRFDFAGSPVGFFEALDRQQQVSYGAFLRLGDTCILSLSPELFFRMEKGQIVTRPMKGTAPRGRYGAEDLEIAQWLQQDEKNRSENVMIVDLLRSDLGRIAQVGSVRVARMFEVEKYATLFQMVSTVSARLRSGLRLHDIFAAVFPSGSVTGAPKIRTMQIIRALETEPRGVYTGAIGFFSPASEAVFSVPIRTAVIQGNKGEMGVGSGVVFDSLPDAEYEECRLKTRFLVGAKEEFRLLESMLWDGKYQLLDLHVQRLEASADYFGFAFCAADLLAALECNQEQLQSGLRYKVRLLMDRNASLTIENLQIDGPPSDTIMLSPVTTSSADRFLFHKTTRRELYDRMYTEARDQGFEDAIFLNERDEVTEGAVSNIFVARQGELWTPPLQCGVLPGVYRRHILESDPRARERVLRLEDLRAADAIYICNAVKGLRKVHLCAQASALVAGRAAVT